jgi:hypothetical protein
VAKTKNKPKKAKKSQKVEDTAEGAFVLEWLEEACDESKALNAIFSDSSKKTLRTFIAAMCELCDDYAEALYDDEGDDEEDYSDDDEDDDEDDED